MTPSVRHISTFARIQFRRHLRNPALWLVALATPIAARFMVPGPASDYSVITVNSARPVLTSGVIGMELGIIAALLLSPFAYIFLRASPTRIVPWQIDDISPTRHAAQMLGNWIADTAVLWLVLFCLALAGVIISFFRLPIEDISPLETLFATMVIAAPALAFIAALRTFFSARPKLRGAGGDVVFFLVWLGGIMMASAYFMAGTTPLAISDLFGWAASLSGGVEAEIHSIAIGSSFGMSGFIDIDAMSGVLNRDFLLSRVFWLVMAALLAGLGGLAYRPRSPSHRGKKLSDKKYVTALAGWADKFLGLLLPKTTRTFAPIWVNFSQIIAPKLYIFILVAAATLGWFLPFRTYAGPAIWLALLFPLTVHSGRWQSRNLTGFTASLPTSKYMQFLWRLLASMLLALFVCLPAIARASIDKQINVVPDIAFMVIGLPVIIMALGALTRSAFFARLLLLLAWYLYLNL